MGSKYPTTMRVLAYLLAALSVAAAIPKILQMPQELGFLKALGFSAIAVTILGLIQLTGGVLLLWRKYCLQGAILAALALLVSSIAIFMGGNTNFGLISLLPFVVAIIVAYDASASKKRT